MSFSIYMTRYEDGAPSPFSGRQLELLFSPFVKARDSSFADVAFDELHSFTIYMDEFDDNLAINSHFADDRLFDRLFDLMRTGNFVLYWPGCLFPVIVDTAAAAHLPGDMIESLGQPVVIGSGRDMIDAINRSDAQQEGNHGRL